MQLQLQFALAVCSDLSRVDKEAACYVWAPTCPQSSKTCSRTVQPRSTTIQYNHTQYNHAVQPYTVHQRRVIGVCAPTTRKWYARVSCDAVVAGVLACCKCIVFCCCACGVRTFSGVHRPDHPHHGRLRGSRCACRRRLQLCLGHLHGVDKRNAWQCTSIPATCNASSSSTAQQARTASNHRTITSTPRIIGRVCQCQMANTKYRSGVQV